MTRAVRYDSLDAIRGFAALSVVTAHTISAGLVDNHQVWDWLEWSPIRFIYAGHQAVIMFFVLSGMALTIMINSMPRYSYSRYFIARAARLWPPYATSILLTVLVVCLLKYFGVHWNNGWAGILPNSFTYKDIYSSIIMLGSFNPFAINPPIWSLIQEMRISIIFPLLLIIVSRYSLYSVLFFLLISIACCLHFYGVQYADLSKSLDSYVFTLSFLLPFSLGCHIGINIPIIREKVISLPRKVIWTSFIISYSIYSYSFTVSWWASYRLAGDIVASCSSAVIICLSLKIDKSWFLSIGKYLGKISYSLYLTHMIALTILMTIGYKDNNSTYSILLMIPLSIAIAHIFTLTVDSASIKLSRSIYRR